VNDLGFWDIAYRDNAPTLLGILRRYVKDVNIAQDLLHEVFITAIDKYDSYASRGNFEAWLYRITVNTALMYLRNERNEQSISEMTLSIIDDTEDEAISNDRDAMRNVSTAIEAAEFTGEELLAAIDRLPEHHKLVFNMYVMDDFSHKKIAAELNISPGTSKSHLARARKKIQQFLYDDALNK
jgi:RNA polymerase sigma factor (sigma-70 family)